MSADKKWNDGAFLLELKPHADFANLFVCCTEGRTQEAIKVVQDGIEVGVCGDNHRDLREDRARATAKIAEIRMFPNSLSSLAWADHDTLFTCRVKAETIDVAIEPKSRTELAREIRGRLKLDEFCTSLKHSRAFIKCSYCLEPLIDEHSMSLTRFFTLPNDDWHEKAQSLDFFCCGAGDCDGGKSDSLSTAAPSSSGQCFLADSYFLLDESQTKETVEETEGGLLQCKHCLSELGCRFTSGPNSVHKFYHTRVDFGYKSEEAKTVSYLSDRFGNVEHYFAWLILTQSQAQSSLKFIFKSLDKRPRLLVWLLDSYSVMVRGKLSIVTSSKEEDEPWQPFPALKILYKIYEESATSDPRAMGQDFSVGEIRQPSGACLAFIQLLLDSSQTLPPACRAVGQFYVGYLKISETLE